MKPSACLALAGLVCMSSSVAHGSLAKRQVDAPVASLKTPRIDARQSLLPEHRSSSSRDNLQIAQLQRGGGRGGGSLRNLIEGAGGGQRQRLKGGGNNSNRNSGGQFDDGFSNSPSRQMQQPQTMQPAPPPAATKPRPVLTGPLVVQEFPPNRIASPTAPPASLRSSLLQDMDGRVSDEVDVIEAVLRAAEISDVSTRALLSKAKRWAGDGLDADLLGDMRRAVVEKDAVKVDEVGLALAFPAEDLDTVVLATFVAELRKSAENAVDPNDVRATSDVRKCADRFRKKIRRTSILDKEFRDGINDRLNAIIWVLDARDELFRTADAARDATGGELSWPTGEVTVLASPTIKPGTVYYVSPNLVVAGTSAPGPVSLIKSSVAAAFDCWGFNGADSTVAANPPLEVGNFIAIVNAPGSPKDFAFQLNGYDYSLKPGAMYRFATVGTPRVETFRYPSRSGEMSGGFDLKEKDGTPTKDGWLVMTWDGAGWECNRKIRAPFHIAATTLSVPATFIFNDTNRPVTFTFNRSSHTLAPASGKAFDKVDDWRIRFASTKAKSAQHPKEGERNFTLAAGKSFRICWDEDGLDLKSRPAETMTVSNAGNALPFSYRLGEKLYSLAPNGEQLHSFAVPPTTMTLGYDLGNGRIASLPVAPGASYAVGLSPALDFTLSADRDSASPTIDSLRRTSLDQAAQLLARAESYADVRREQRAAAAEVTDKPVDPPVVTAREQRPPAAPKGSPRALRSSAHVLAIGVSDYRDDKFNLKFPGVDAKDFSEVFRRAAGDMFEEVTTDVLVNERATKLNIDKALNDWTVNVDDGDLAVLFFSAHGKSDAERYYLCPHDFDPDDLISTAVKYSDIVDAVRTLGRRDCQVMILADTCYSSALGSALGAKSARSGTLLDAHKVAVRDQPAGARGSCMLLASSSVNGESFERDQWQHGAFTKALLDAIDDPATDADGDGMLFAGELASAVRKEVRRLTNNQQRPQLSWPPNDKDFPLLKTSR